MGLSTFRKLAEADARDTDIEDVEEYDLAEYYEELMEDIKEDLEDLRDIAKQAGLKNNITSQINDIFTTIGNIDDAIGAELEAMDNDDEADEENEGKW